METNFFVKLRILCLGHIMIIISFLDNSHHFHYYEATECWKLQPFNTTTLVKFYNHNCIYMNIYINDHSSLILFYRLYFLQLFTQQMSFLLYVKMKRCTWNTHTHIHKAITAIFVQANIRASIWKYRCALDIPIYTFSK